MHEPLLDLVKSSLIWRLFVTFITIGSLSKCLWVAYASCELSDRGIQDGINCSEDGCAAWIGSDGPFTVEFENLSGSPICLVLWGPMGSWVNADQPLITYALTDGASTNVSMMSGLSGGWAAVFEDTELVNGQIAETWGEFTFNGDFSTFDVSREVNMNGHDMTIESSDCVSNMTACVFECIYGESCWEIYRLYNCDTGSQRGATYGIYDGAVSGGCLLGPGNYAKATFG